MRVGGAFWTFLPGGSCHALLTLTGEETDMASCACGQQDHMRSHVPRASHEEGSCCACVKTCPLASPTSVLTHLPGSDARLTWGPGTRRSSLHGASPGRSLTVVLDKAESTFGLCWTHSNHSHQQCDLKYRLWLEDTLMFQFCSGSFVREAWRVSSRLNVYHIFLLVAY